MKNLILLLPALLFYNYCSYGQISNRATQPNSSFNPAAANQSCNCPPTVDGSRLSVQFSGGGNLLYTYGSEPLDNFDVDNIGWQAGLMIGLRYGNAKLGQNSTIGVFLNTGNTTANNMGTFLENRGSQTSFSGKSENPFYQVEGGVLLLDLLRVSAGVGRQDFQDLDNNAQQIYYYSATTGLHLGSGVVRLLIDVNFLFGRDMQETMYRPMLGLGIRL